MIPTTLSKNNTNILETILNTIKIVRDDVVCIKADIVVLKKSDEIIKADIAELKRSNEIIKTDIAMLKKNDEKMKTDISSLKKGYVNLNANINKLRKDLNDNMKDVALEFTHTHNCIEAMQTEMKLQRGIINMIPQIYEIVIGLKEKNVGNEQDHAYYYQKIGEHDTRLRKLEST